MKRTFFLFIFLQSFLSFGQEKKAEESYVDYFKLPRESLFLHTNKTSYIIGEEIWFKAYAYDRRNHLPSRATKNIHLGIYDEDGNQIDKKLFLAEEGFAVGNIPIDPELTTGIYFLKISTNWMKNFHEDDSFVQKIRITNPTSQEYSFQNTIDKEYDFQFLPEGGHLISDIKNNVGVKVIDDTGKGTRSNGIVFDSKGNQVTAFKSNFLGLGKFSFTPKPEETYSAKVILDNSKEIDVKLPKSESIGITLQVNNLKADKVIIDLMANSKSLKLFEGQVFKLLIHKDGIAKIIPIRFQNLIERVSIDKKGLFKGVNTITLFNNKEEPILERMFFNELLVKNHRLSISPDLTKGDSIRYHIRSNSTDSILHTSISVLPKGTISYKPKHNIISAYYLKPYLKGHIENPQYYFLNTNRKKKYELDILLLTQGWSRYDWNRIFKNTPKSNFEFENGITILGSLNNSISRAKDLLLYPTALHSSKFIHFDKDGKFALKNFYLKSDEVLKFSLTSRKGKAKPPSIAVSSLKVLDKDSIDTKNYQEFSSFYANRTTIPLNFLTDETEVLDEVVVSSRLKRVFDKRGPPFSGKIIKINDTLVKSHFTIDRVLNQERFIVSYGIDVSISSPGRDPRPVFFYVDGALVQNMHNFLTSNLVEYEDIYIDYSFNNVTVNGLNISGAILVNLFSRISPFKDVNLQSKPFRIIKLDTGFEPTKKFYTPRYVMYDIQSFKDNGVIHWEPNAVIKRNESFIMTTINTNLKEINFYVEGISSNGDLISQVIRVQK